MGARLRCTKVSLAVSWAMAAMIFAGCTREVAAGLDEAEANRAVIALARAGVDAEKVADPTTDGRYRLVVAREEATIAIFVLGDEELPRARSSVAREGSLIASPDAERGARVAATSAQIERSLGSIDGVFDARVLLDVPVTDPLMAAVGTTPVLRPTASVLLRYRGTTPPIELEDVKRLVAGAVSGLATQDVAVVTVPVAAPLVSGDRALAHLGPIAVTRTSVGTLRLVALVLLGTFALLGGVVLALAARLRRLRSLLPAGEPSA